MAPQLYITMYKEQFASPGRTKREQLRPTSANRRNNPQPQPDFLFPRSLQPNYSSRRTLPRPPPPADTGRPLFPPVRHLSFQSPVTTCPDNYLNPVDVGKPNQMPPIDTSSLQALPSADGLQKLQPIAGPAVKLHTPMKYPRQGQIARLGTRPQTSITATQPHVPLTHYRRSSSNGSLDYSSRCYSCFHVVRPYQAGHYIIHPEFVSECLR